MVKRPVLVPGSDAEASLAARVRVGRVETTIQHDVFNMGQHLGAPPPHIIIDTELAEAAWLSAAGFQAIKLDQIIERPLQHLAAPPVWARAAEPPV